MIEVVLSGFFFWFIIVTNIASGRFGYETFSKLDPDAKLQEIGTDPKKFKIGFAFIFVEHLGIICLANLLFLAYSPTNLLLAAIWTIARLTEALIQISNKRNYWGLLSLSRKYLSSSGAEKKESSDVGLSILKKKNTVFTFAQVLFSIGTLAYSIMFVTSEAIPVAIGWFGVVSSILYGLGSGIKLIKTEFKALWNIGGLLILIFELVLGGWLLFSPLL
ncbi:MAG: DUF4386 domain-containing protein [Candidatus Bathyarchaeota archaeon]